jgi:hypothetical protein
MPRTAIYCQALESNTYRAIDDRLRSPAARVRDAAGRRLATRPLGARGIRPAALPRDAGLALAPDAARPLDAVTPGAQARPLPSGRFRPPGWVAAAGGAATAQVLVDRLSEASPPPLAKQRLLGSSRSSARSRSAQRSGGYLDCVRQTRSPSSVAPFAPVPASHGVARSPRRCICDAKH